MSTLAIKKTDLFKLHLTLSVFAISVPFTLSGNPVVGNLSLATAWLVAFSFISRDNYFAKLYFLLFGVFFICPPLFSEAENFLAVGFFFKTIELSGTETVWLQIAIYVFLIAFSLSAFSIRVRRPTTDQRVTRIAHPAAFTCLMIATFLTTILFNAREISAVYTKGYQAYFSGDLGIQKSLPVFLLENVFLVLCVIGISRGRMLPLVLLCVYGLSFSMAGQRMPGFLLMIIAIAIAHPASFFSRRIFLLAMLGLGVAPPFFMTIQTLRAVGVDGLQIVDIWYFYTDFWAVIAHSMDTLKTAVISYRLEETSVNLAARLSGTLNVIFSRIFGLELGLNSVGFGAAFSSQMAPDLFFERGVTFASSGIAEAYYVGSYFGVALYGVGAFVVCKYLQEAMYRMDALSVLLILIFAPRFLVGVRNELFGWVFEGVIYFAVAYPMFVACKSIFMRSQG